MTNQLSDKMASNNTSSNVTRKKVYSDRKSVEIKSKFDAEFRRFSVDLDELRAFEDFKRLLESIHHAEANSLAFSYVDPSDNSDLLPITNTSNLSLALKLSKPLLRVVVQREAECQNSFYLTRSNGRLNSSSGSYNKLNTSRFNASKLLSVSNSNSSGHQFSALGNHENNVISISKPSEFRQVSAIIDVDLVPETCRRVRLLKHAATNDNKPLGFYIRDGTSVRVTPSGLEKVPGIFISRLVPGGLAESTGLLAVNDEVLEVNGIEVVGKTLDQVTDMMVANSSNLIITVKPADQRTLTRGSLPRNSAHTLSSQGSMASNRSNQQQFSDEHEDEDEIRDLTTTSHFAAMTNNSVSGGARSKEVLRL